MDVAMKALAHTYAQGSMSDGSEGVKRCWEVLAKLESPCSNSGWPLLKAKAEANHFLMPPREFAHEVQNTINQSQNLVLERDD